MIPSYSWTSTVKMSPSTDRVHLFPTFLLPSFTVPFRRRRTSSVSDTKWPAGARAIVNRNSSPVPSLSSSPTSTISDADPASPSDIDTHPAPLDWADLEDGCESPLPKIHPGTIHRPQPDTIRCGSCASDIAFGAQIVSKGFTGRYGRAFLVSPPASLSPTPVDLALDRRPYGLSKRDAEALDDTELLNINIGSRENRQLVTGAHVVADISCAVCGTKIGWKYVEATEAAQKYKEGKFILETQRVVVFRSWEDVEDVVRDRVEYAARRRSSSLRKSVDSESDGKTATAETSKKGENDDHLERVISFDSEDEDECEDIFAGTWDPAVVVQRWKKKVSRLRGKKG